MLFFRKKDPSDKDRRGKDRVLFRHTINLLVPSLASGEGYIEVSCRNISVGGVLVETERCYPAMVPCRIKIQVPEISEMIIQGVITWTEENNQTKKWDIGISFTNLSSHDRSALKKIIDQSA